MMSTVLPMLVPAGVLLGAGLVRRSRLAGPAALGVLGLMLMGAKRAPDRSHEIGLSGSTGRHTTACGGTVPYSAGGLEYRYVAPISEVTSGSVDVAGGVVATERETEEGWRESATYPHYRLGGGLEHEFVAVAGGIAGNTSWDPLILPAGRLRLGPEDLFSVEARFGWERPTAFPGRFTTFGAGIGLPRLHPTWEKGRLLLGASHLGETNPLGIGGELELPLGRFTVTPSVLYGVGDETNLPYWFGLDLRVAIPAKGAAGR